MEFRVSFLHDFRPGLARAGISKHAELPGFRGTQGLWVQSDGCSVSVGPIERVGPAGSRACRVDGAARAAIVSVAEEDAGALSPRQNGES